MPPAGARRAARLARRASGYQNIKLLSSLAVARRAFLLGGSGQTGRALIPRLEQRGWEVVVASRGERDLPGGVEHVTVDRGAEGALDAAVGDGADLLVDFAAFEPEHAEQLLALRGRVGSLVVLSSAAVYFPEDEAEFARLPVPIAERTQTVAPGPGGYAAKKRAIELALLRQDALPATLIRSGAIQGPWSTSPRTPRLAATATGRSTGRPQRRSWRARSTTPPTTSSSRASRPTEPSPNVVQQLRGRGLGDRHREVERAACDHLRRSRRLVVRH